MLTMPNLRVNGSMIFSMDMVLRLGERLMDLKLIIQVISTKERKTEKADLTGKMVHTMKVILLMAIFKVLVNITLQI